jgi:hypothetical protein
MKIDVAGRPNQKRVFNDDDGGERPAKVAKTEN